MPVAWHQALKSKLDQLVISAARPARDPVPTNAAAVVFLDRSELMACLASDWCERRLATNWWWQSLLKRGEAALEIVKKQWRKNPKYVPAAMQHLVKRKKAIAFVSAFTDSEARALVQSVAQAFALQALIPVLDQSSHGLARFPMTRQKTTGPLPATLKEQDNPVKSNSLTSPHPPWHEWISENETRQLGPDKQLFLGLALMLHCAPAKVRTPRFAAAVEQWQREISFQPEPHLISRSISGKEPRGTSPQQNSAGSVDMVPGVPNREHRVEVPTGESGKDSIARSHTVIDGEAQQYKTHLPEFTPPPLASARTGLGPYAKASSETVVRTTSGEIDRLEEVTISSAPFEDLETQVETQYGGIFYLINLALYLELYGDFTTPLVPGLALNIWDFLALVGRELIGDRAQDDPVRRLLTRLAARDELTPPGDDFEPEDEWRIPHEWLTPFSAGAPCVWTTAGGRLRLFHPDRFVVFDVPLQPGNRSDQIKQLEREMEAYRNFELEVSTVELAEYPAWKEELGTRNTNPETAPQVATWLDRLLPYVRARLKLAVGSDDLESLLRTVFEHRAGVFVTGALR